MLVLYPALRSRDTDWRTFRIGRPSRLNCVGIDDRLVAHVERAQSGLLEERARLRADAERGEPERSLLREVHEDRKQRLDGLLLADRVAGDHEHAALDAVADEGGLFGIEEVLLVGRAA